MRRAVLLMLAITLPAAVAAQHAAVPPPPRIVDLGHPLSDTDPTWSGKPVFSHATQRQGDILVGIVFDRRAFRHARRRACALRARRLDDRSDSGHPLRSTRRDAGSPREVREERGLSRHEGGHRPVRAAQRCHRAWHDRPRGHGVGRPMERPGAVPQRARRRHALPRLLDGGRDGPHRGSRRGRARHRHAEHRLRALDRLRGASHHAAAQGLQHRERGAPEPTCRPPGSPSSSRRST